MDRCQYIAALSCVVNVGTSGATVETTGFLLVSSAPCSLSASVMMVVGDDG